MADVKLATGDVPRVNTGHDVLLRLAPTTVEPRIDTPVAAPPLVYPSDTLDVMDRGLASGRGQAPKIMSREEMAAREAERAPADALEPAGPSLTEDEAEFGRRMNSVMDSPEFAAAGERTPVTLHKNPKHGVAVDLMSSFAGSPGMPTFEKTMAELGIDVSPFPEFDEDAAATSYVPPTMLESETREEYNARAQAMGLQHIALAKAEHDLAATAHGEKIQDLRQKFGEEMQARKRDMDFINEPGGPNLFQAEVEGHKMRTEAEQTQLDTLSSRMEQTAFEMRDATAQIRQNEDIRRQRVEDEYQAAQKVQSVLSDARQRLQSREDPDSGRYFKSMTGGQKFLAIVGGMLTGWNGSSMVPQLLMQLAEKDLEAQKATIAQDQAVVGAAEAEHAGQMNIYRHILAQVTDQRVADLSYLALQMEDAERMLQAEMARTTVDIHKATMYQAMVGIKAQQAQLYAKLDMAVKATPEMVARGGGLVATKPQLKMLEHAANARTSEGAQVIGRAAGRPYDAAKGEREHEQRMELEAGKAQAKAAAEDTGDPSEGVVHTIRYMRDKYGGNYPKAGLSAIGTKIAGTDAYEEGKAFEAEREMLVGQVARLLDPVGQISESARDAARAMVGEGDLTDAGVEARLNAIENLATSSAKAHGWRSNKPLKTLQMVQEE